MQLAQKTENPEFIKQVEKKFPNKETKILIGCSDGRMYSMDALMQLDEAGYTNIAGGHVKHGHGVALHMATHMPHAQEATAAACALAACAVLVCQTAGQVVSYCMYCPAPIDGVQASRVATMPGSPSSPTSWSGDDMASTQRTTRTAQTLQASTPQEQALSDQTLWRSLCPQRATEHAQAAMQNPRADRKWH